MSKRKAVLALALLVPAPSIGAWCAMVAFPDSLPGVLVFGLAKAWLLTLPLVWTRFVCAEPFSLSSARNGGFMAGILSGCVISAFILAVYFTLGDSFIDKRFLVERLTGIGLASPPAYIAGAAYWILVNSVLEEYVWRWFCVKQCRQLLRPPVAVLCSAFFFTIHHIVAMRVYFGPLTVLLCALGILVGGAIWSAMYVRYRSIWPGYVSHLIVDLCVFAIGASLLF